MAKSRVAKRLAGAIMQLLPEVNEVVAAHRAADADRCRHCAIVDPRDCPTLGLAAAFLDLIIHCWRLTTSERDGRDLAGDGKRTAVATPHDLRAAVESKQLTSTEADALTEILDALELAGTQADDAGICLPILAGIGVAVVDTYRAAVADLSDQPDAMSSSASTG